MVAQKPQVLLGLLRRVISHSQGSNQTRGPTNKNQQDLVEHARCLSQPPPISMAKLRAHQSRSQLSDNAEIRGSPGSSTEVADERTG